MSNLNEESIPVNRKMSSTDGNKGHSHKNYLTGNELWTDGLICAFEYVSGRKKKQKYRRCHLPTGKFGQSTNKNQWSPVSSRSSQVNANEAFLQHGRTAIASNEKNDNEEVEELAAREGLAGARDLQNERTAEGKGTLEECCWIPIGWARLSELVKMVQINAEWASQMPDSSDEDDSLTVADIAAPYRERPVGPTWWCHVMAGHPFIDSWLKNAQWLHPAISTALRDESRLISERMKHLYYEVPVRVAGGLLFELLGQSIGDPQREEEDVPIVLRSWQAQNFLVTSLHVKGTISCLNVLGIIEVQDLLVSEGLNAPRMVHELIAHLACRLARWDDRLFRKYVFGEADEIELKFVNRRNKEDLNLLSIILNQEIKRLSTEVSNLLHDCLEACFKSQRLPFN